VPDPVPDDVEQILIDPVGAWPDPDRVATRVVRADPTALCLAAATAAVVAGHGGPAAAWSACWASAEAAAQAAIDRTLAAHREVTEPAAARLLAAVLPLGATLFCSSSMPIRDLEWYAPARHGLSVLANRGANGIDGIVSTALGVALAEPGRCTAVLAGDLAFLYDASALVGAVRRKLSLTIVVVDNDGGGIFSFLPQASEVDGSMFERLWGTPHGLDIGAVAGAYGIPVERVGTAAGIPEAVRRALRAGGVRALVVRTDRAANVTVHDELHAAVAEAVGGACG
jgi:2-succinyl-5-enolpyruvyl-6-hydroxy-3-cyclohexene-1-carboxylate synthase